jgi:hypothetical protein
MLKPPGRGSRSLGTSRDEEMRRAGLTGDEILSAHVYRGGVSVVVDYTRV